ncbi:MAG: serine hydrolase domain-containing protein [Candidatus Babeliales bacterium]
MQANKRQIIKHLLFTALLATISSSLQCYSSWEEATAALLREYGINESHAHKPNPKRSWAKEKSDAQTRRLSCCKNDQTCKQGFNPDRLDILDAKVQEIVADTLGVGVYTTAVIKSTCGKFIEHKFFAGVENVQTQKPATGDTINRAASMSKFLGTVGFLKLIDRGVLTGFEQLSTFIPEFANTKVMENFTPTATVTLNNVITATIGSTILNINEVAHGRSTGDWIGITGSTAVQGVPASQINNIHQITIIDANNYTITVATPATGTSPIGEGGLIQVNSLAAGVKQSVWLGVTYYYVELPLERPILLYHVMTHELGYSYSIPQIGLAFGFAEDITLRNTQAGIFTALQIPLGFPNPAFPLSSQTILQWAQAVAQVPLLFQPGTNWSYGPTLSILGAVIEIIDGRDLETYMQEEVLRPLGMNSTGFYIQNDAPDRAEKLARIQTMYLGGTTIPVTAVPPIAFTEDYFYGLNQPKTLALIDGGFYYTAHDYLKFIKMLLNNGYAQSGESILSPNMLIWLSENHTLENSVYNLNDAVPSTLTPGKWAKWGLGTAVIAGSTMGIFAGLPLIGCSTRTIGWTGFFNTFYNADITNNVGVSVGTNVFPSAANPLVRAAPRKLETLNYAALKCSNPNNENTSANNPSTSTNPT